MNHPERVVSDYNDILSIMEGCEELSLALMDGDYPYVIEMNFGFEDLNGTPVIYLHGANTGKKLDLIRANSHAAFSMSRAHSLMPGKVPCATKFLYESVIGQGNIEIVEDVEEKCHALTVLMRHYDKQQEHAFDARHAACHSGA